MIDISQIYSMANCAPVNIEAIIRSLGLSVARDSELPENISGQIHRTKDGGYELSSKFGEHYFRQRFSLAHELGHYVLHRSLIGEGVDDDKLYRSTAEGNFYNTSIELAHERQANSFAASLLMPEKLVRDEVENGNTTIAGLYKKFQVSHSAMNWRLRALKLSDRVEGAD